MDDGDSNGRQLLMRKLINKTALNQKVFESTFSVFTQLKEVLHELSSEVDDEMEEINNEDVKMDYRDRGKFEAQLHFADEILVFSMHTNVFGFDRAHSIWENPYVQENKDNSYCGIINIYNFLSDSFKFNRNADEGYLIGRIFVNQEKQYYVEGKRQTIRRNGDFGRQTIDKAALLSIVETAIDYSLDFDLLVPPYEATKVLTADQLNTKMENSKIRTGKRLGYEFIIDDI